MRRCNRKACTIAAAAVRLLSRTSARLYSLAKSWKGGKKASVSFASSAKALQGREGEQGEC